MQIITVGLPLPRTTLKNTKMQLSDLRCKYKCIYQFHLLLSRHDCAESYIHSMHSGSDARSLSLTHTLAFPAAPSFGRKYLCLLSSYASKYSRRNARQEGSNVVMANSRSALYCAARLTAKIYCACALIIRIVRTKNLLCPRTNFWFCPVLACNYYASPKISICILIKGC